MAHPSDYLFSVGVPGSVHHGTLSVPFSGTSPSSRLTLSTLSEVRLMDYYVSHEGLIKDPFKNYFYGQGTTKKKIISLFLCEWIQGKQLVWWNGGAEAGVRCGGRYWGERVLGFQAFVLFQGLFNWLTQSVRARFTFPSKHHTRLSPGQSPFQKNKLKLFLLY